MARRADTGLVVGRSYRLGDCLRRAAVAWGQGRTELLGERFCGILVTDRWSAYTWYPTRWRQVCWAHLLRDIEAMMDRGGRSQEIGEALREQARQMFHWWHQVRDAHSLTRVSAS